MSSNTTGVLPRSSISQRWAEDSGWAGRDMYIYIFNIYIYAAGCDLERSGRKKCIMFHIVEICVRMHWCFENTIINWCMCFFPKWGDHTFRGWSYQWTIVILIIVLAAVVILIAVDLIVKVLRLATSGNWDVQHISVSSQPGCWVSCWPCISWSYNIARL